MTSSTASGYIIVRWYQQRRQGTRCAPSERYSEPAVGPWPRVPRARAPTLEAVADRIPQTGTASRGAGDVDGRSAPPGRSGVATANQAKIRYQSVTSTAGQSGRCGRRIPGTTFPGMATMATRDPVLKALRRHEVPAWWRDAKLGIFVHWTPASVPGFAPVDDDVTAMVQSGDRRAMGWSPYTEWYENSLRFPDSPVARHHRGDYGTRPYRDFAADWEAGPRHVGSRRLGPHVRGHRCALRRAGHEASRRLLPLAVDGARTRAGPAGTARVTSWASSARRCAAQGMRFGVYYSGGLDWTFDDRPMGSMSDLIAAIPRGDYPDYAGPRSCASSSRGTGRACSGTTSCGRARASTCGRCSPSTTTPSRTAWSTTAGCRGTRSPVRCGSAPPARSSTPAPPGRPARTPGSIPPEPPFYDVRTPEYVTFPTIQRRPWECVRGMDHSFGYNAASRPEDFLTRADLLWSFADMVSKNGNLLLNVGPGASTRRSPTSSGCDSSGSANGSAPTRRPCGRRAHGSGPATSRPRASAVRYTAHDEMCSRSSSDGGAGDDAPRRRGDADHRRHRRWRRRPTAVADDRRADCGWSSATRSAVDAASW